MTECRRQPGGDIGVERPTFGDQVGHGLGRQAETSGKAGRRQMQSGKHIFAEDFARMGRGGIEVFDGLEHGTLWLAGSFAVTIMAASRAGIGAGLRPIRGIWLSGRSGDADPKSDLSQAPSPNRYSLLKGEMRI